MSLSNESLFIYVILVCIHNRFMVRSLTYALPNFYKFVAKCFHSSSHTKLFTKLLKFLLRSFNIAFCAHTPTWCTNEVFYILLQMYKC